MPLAIKVCLFLALAALPAIATPFPEGCLPQALFPRYFYMNTFNPQRTQLVRPSSPLVCRAGKRGSKLSVRPQSVVYEATGVKGKYHENAFHDGWGKVPTYLEISFAQNKDGSLNKKSCFAKVNSRLIRYSLEPRNFEQWMRRMQALIQQYVEGRCPVSGSKRFPALLGLRGSFDTLASLFNTYTCINIYT